VGYIQFPIETNPTTLLQQVYSYLQSVIPGWTPAEGNLDVWLAEAMSSEAAQTATVASSVPDTIVEYLGKTLFNVPGIDDVSASGGTTWVVQDTAGYTIPSGTQVGVRDADGNLQAFTTVNTVVIPNGHNSTGAGEVAILAVNPGSSGNGLSGSVQLVDILTFVTSVTLVAPTAGGQDAETSGDYLSRFVADLQLLSPTPILPPDFAVLALNAGTAAFRAVALDGYNPYHNYLNANDSSFETSVAGWAVSVNCTLADSSTTALDGTKSMSMTSVASGTMSAIVVDADKQAVNPGDTWISGAFFKSAASARTVETAINWYTSGDAFIGAVGGAGVVNTTTGWTEAFCVAVAPPTAAYARIQVTVVGTGGASEIHYVDEAYLRRNNINGNWSIGGTPENNNPREVTVVAVDSSGANLSSGDKTTITTYLNSLREANWITNAIDPIRTSVDVTVQVKVTTGSDPTITQTAVVAAITNYLSAVNWGLNVVADGSTDIHSWTNQVVIYRYKLAQIIEEVDGVDHIVGNLTTAIHGNSLAEQDLAISGPVGLPAVGTITVTTS
jgi:hypothetical protein